MYNPTILIKILDFFWYNRFNRYEFADKKKMYNKLLTKEDFNNESKLKGKKFRRISY